jgi:predicted small lipoprotein YifL
MKKNLIRIFIIFCALITITACGSKDKLNLKVTATNWSYGQNMQAPEEEFYYDVELDEKYTVKEGRLGLTFTITEINKDSIVIKTTEPFSEGEEGINLQSKQKEFTIKKGEKIRLTTPTMDAGGIYYLELN